LATHWENTILPSLPALREVVFSANRRLLGMVAEALYVVDAAGRIVFLHPAALKLLGYADERSPPSCCPMS
jgi:PAS domain-containing protein